MGTTGKLAPFEQIKDYFELVAEESDSVEYEVVGTTTMGNEYPIMRVSSAENLARIDEILAANERLADPRADLSESEARALAEQSVPVYYLEATLHSVEVGNLPALVDVIHRLSTERSEYVQNILDNLVILVVPSANPDGQHLMVDYFNETEGTSYARTYPDLYHKYTGHDNNRDWIFHTQVESRIRLQLEQQYRPVFLHLMHQSGTNSPRMWVPPFDEPLGPNVDSIAISASNAVGAEVANAAAEAGLTGVSSDDAYGIFWNADVFGTGPHRGASLFLHELAAARDLALPYSNPDGTPPGATDRTMRTFDPYTGPTWTLEQIVEYATLSMYTALDTVAEDADDWLFNNLYQLNRKNMEPDGGPETYLVPAGQRDPFAVKQLVEIFDLAGVEVDRALSTVRVDRTTYPAGTLLIQSQQPMGSWVDQVLEVDQYPDEARKCAACPLIMPYSETTDNLGMLLGLTVQPVDDARVARTERITAEDVTAPAVPNPPANGAYLVRPTSYGLTHAIARLQEDGVPVFRAAAAFQAGNAAYEPGTLIVPATAAARATLTEVSQLTALPVTTAPQVPAVNALELKPNTKIGLIRGANNMPGGWLMWLADTYGLNYEVVEADDYANLAQFDTILVAPGITKARIVTGLNPAVVQEEFHWARGVGEAGWQALATWVRDGGNLVAVGAAAETARELLALPITNATPADRAAFNAPGTLLNAQFDPAVPATWGMPANWPVWYYNSPAYRVTAGSGATVGATYPTSGELLASGYAHGQAALSGLANVVTVPVGAGEATVASADITFRSWPRAAWTIVSNALYNGPGTAVPAAELAARVTGR
ncbi:M14 family zinc carboxypeptidase [Jiangella alkaliphila]|nr:M14 family zinc carboxypeptidase [Jiangella alkaliphila]